VTATRRLSAGESGRKEKITQALRNHSPHRIRRRSHIIDICWKFSSLWGSVGPGAPILAGKRCISKVPRSASASDNKRYNCYITMLQRQIWARGTGNAGEWEALTRGTQGKKRILSLHTCCEFQPGFCCQSRGPKQRK